jgi:protein-L-isoaspartate(D-aspartate) O-methyltransferase
MMSYGTSPMLDFAQARRTMVDSQLRTFDVTDRAILAAMGETPREHYMPSGRESLAYSDLNVPLSDPRGSEPRVMLSPMVLARLIQALNIRSGARVLDVASGLGYSSAVLARLGASVVALESDASLAELSRKRLAQDVQTVLVNSGPLIAGCPGDGPFDAILINGAVHSRPEPLLQQLREGGQLACLLAGDGPTRAVIYLRSGGAFGAKTLFEATAPELAEFRPAPAFVF